MSEKLKSVNNNGEKEDDFSKLIGQVGKWQTGIFFMLFFSKLPSGWHLMGIVFLTPKIIFRCSQFAENVTMLAENVTILAENSTCYDNCIKYEYDNTPFDNTIVSEWDLICDRHWMSSFVQTMIMLGVLFGSAVFGFFSDRYGRKNTYLSSIILLIIVSLAQPLSPNYAVFTTLRFLVGFFCGGVMVVSFVILIETFGPKYRELFACLYQLPVNIGFLATALFAYLFRQWRAYIWASAVPCIPFLVYFFFVRESPRWLVSNGRVDEACQIVSEAVKKNKLPIQDSEIKERLTKLSNEISLNKSNKPRVNYLDLVRTPKLRMRSMCSFSIWFLNGICYYGTNQYVGQTSSNPFVSVASSAFFQVPSTFLTIWLLHRYGRRLTLITFYFLTSILLTALAFIPKLFWLNLLLGTIASSTATIVSVTIYIQSSEIFPTVVRNMGMGMCSMFMRIGSMIAPFVSNATVVEWFSGVVIAVAAALAGCVSFALSETKGCVLPDSIEDVENNCDGKTKSLG